MLQTTCEIDKAANIFKLLGNETRLTMLKILDHHDCCICEFVEIFQMSQPAISQHMRKLRDKGFVQEERRGQWVYYSINKESDYYPFTIQVLNLLSQPVDALNELSAKKIENLCD